MTLSEARKKRRKLTSLVEATVTSSPSSTTSLVKLEVAVERPHEANVFPYGSDNCGSVPVTVVSWALRGPGPLVGFLAAGQQGAILVREGGSCTKIIKPVARYMHFLRNECAILAHLQRADGKHVNIILQWRPARGGPRGRGHGPGIGALWRLESSGRAGLLFPARGQVGLAI